MNNKEKVNDPIDMLFSEENCDDLVLYDEEGKESKFMQIALISLDEESYALLKPLFIVNGLSEDAALVFAIDKEERKLRLTLDEEIVDKVFNEYYQIFNETTKL